MRGDVHRLSRFVDDHRKAGQVGTVVSKTPVGTTPDGKQLVRYTIRYRDAAGAGTPDPQSRPATSRLRKLTGARPGIRTAPRRLLSRLPSSPQKALRQAKAIRPPVPAH